MDNEIALVLVLSAIVVTLLIFVVSFNRKAKRLNEIAVKKRQEIDASSIPEMVEKLKQGISEIESKVESGNAVFDTLNEELTQTNNKLSYLKVGLLPPTFKFDDRETLKEEIVKCHEDQYRLIKAGKARTSYTNWTWFGSAAKGRQMLDAYNHLMLKAFNAEFDLIRKQMRHSSFDTAESKLYRLSEQLERLGETAHVEISHEYTELKNEELAIWHRELAHRDEQKQAKKEQQAKLRKQNKKGQVDPEDLEDEIYDRNADLKRAQTIARERHGDDAATIELEIQRLQKDIAELERKFERAVSQAQITKAGYIYVISNLGSFGEGVVKIGMTRRLEPIDRVKELGDASVPFKFDVHTLVFVENAPSIEKELHRRFHQKRVNTENHRKEFFRVTPQEVQDAMQELGIVSDWFFEVEAREYRESLLIREAMHSQEQTKVSSHLPETI